MKKVKKLESKLVQNPLMEFTDRYKNNLFNEDFFQSNHFSYSVNVSKDSTKYFHTTETIIIDDTLKYVLKICEASIQNDSLALTLTALQDSINNPYELTIIKQGNQFTSILAITYGVPDTNWRRPVFTTFAKSLFLDKEKYNKGDSLKGKFSFLISGYHTAFDNKFTDTLKVFGLIKTIVK